MFTMINFKKYFNKNVEKPEVEAVSSQEALDISELNRQKAYLSIEARRENAEIQRIERERRKIERQIELESARAQLQELKDELYGDEDEEPEVSDKETMMMNLLTKFLNPQAQNPPSPAPPTPQESNLNPLLDDQALTQIKEKLPKQMVENLKMIDEDSLIKLKRML